VVTQAQIDRIAPNMTQPTESRQVNVAQSGFLQRAWQRSLIELRVVPGARHGPHIYYARYSVSLKQADEFLERACGMPNRQYDRRRFCPRHSFSSKTSCLSLDSRHAHLKLFRIIDVLLLWFAYSDSIIPAFPALSFFPEKGKLDHQTARTVLRWKICEP